MAFGIERDGDSDEHVDAEVRSRLEPCRVGSEREIRTVPVNAVSPGKREKGCPHERIGEARMSEYADWEKEQLAQQALTHATSLNSTASTLHATSPLYPHGFQISNPNVALVRNAQQIQNNNAAAAVAEFDPLGPSKSVPSSANTAATHDHIEKLALTKGAGALESHFNVSDTHGKNAKPNDIDNATFKKIATLYGMIDLGHGPIKIDPKLGPNFQPAVMKNIATMLKTSVGRTLVGDLHGGDKDVTIGYAPDKVTAHQEPTNPNGVSNPLIGSGSYIPFHPDELIGTRDTALVSTPDTVLFHELTHAHHAAHGTTQTGTVTQRPSAHGLDLHHEDVLNKVRNEEYATVGLGAFAQQPISENAYRAQMTATAAPNDHLTRLKYAQRTKYSGYMH